MASRRMFALSVIDTDSFLEMPLTAQALYFHLGMRADDDGFVSSPKRILKLTSCAEDDLRVLIAKGYAIPFESGVLVINHWKLNNKIQKDRYHATLYKEEMKRLQVDETGMYTECIQDVSKTDTQVRLGKDSIDKDSIDTAAAASDPVSKEKEVRHKHGEYKHVLLTEKQYADLIADYGESRTAAAIRKVDEYCESHGKTYKNYYLVIRDWGIDKKGQVQQDDGMLDGIL